MTGWRSAGLGAREAVSDWNIMAIGSPVEFLRQVRQEVGRVTWPSRKETTITTAMVFLMVIAAAIFFFLVDLGLGHLVRVVLGIGG
ncbi:MAG TPA: preprotein translocase subunit SecE [Stellaceae bacterium]|nr:preprotein translocase subunit SecE [Stellaceae bacterium]